MSRDQDDDRFGMPRSAFDAACGAHREISAMGVLRLGMYVPTRLEVRTMPALDLKRILDFWFGESPVELIPSDAQIREVIYELERRTDREALSLKEVMDLCRSYLSEDIAERISQRPHSPREIEATFAECYRKMQAESQISSGNDGNALRGEDVHDDPPETSSESGA